MKPEFRLPRGAVHALALALLICTACSGGPRRKPRIEEPVQIADAPTWIHQPLSWEKLESLERWLDTESKHHDPRFVIEGQLQLNEGRLLFSDRDLRAEQVSRETLSVRVSSAVSGFDNVLANPAASPIQRSRAENGLAAARAMLDGPTTARELSFVSRSSWSARKARTDRMTPLRGAWSRITVHHSAESSSNPNGGSLAESSSSVYGIQKYHMQDPSHRWGDIGYHFLIDSNGRIFEGRSLRWQGAHAGGVNGTNNRQNIGICLLGDYATGSPRPEALKSLEVLLDHLREEHRIPASRVYAHNDFVTTECPGPALARWLRDYR